MVGDVKPSANPKMNAPIELMVTAIQKKVDTLSTMPLPIMVSGGGRERWAEVREVSTAVISSWFVHER